MESNFWSSGAGWTFAVADGVPVEWIHFISSIRHFVFVKAQQPMRRWPLGCLSEGRAPSKLPEVTDDS